MSDNNPTTKWCGHCRANQSIKNFFNRSAGGQWPVCKTCRAEISKRYLQSERGRQWRSKYNRSVQKRRMNKAWAEANLDKIRANGRRNSQHSRTKIRGFLRNILCGVRQRCRNTGLVYKIDLEFLLGLHASQDGRCAITGDAMTNDIGGMLPHNCSVDRINPALGYTRDNVQLVCLYANFMKRKMTMQELIGACRKIIAIHGTDVLTMIA